MCSTSMPAMLLKSSPERCVELPAPDEANDSLPGCAFASATSSTTDFAGTSGGTVSTLVIDVVKDTGSRSFDAS